MGRRLFFLFVSSLYLSSPLFIFILFFIFYFIFMLYNVDDVSNISNEVIAMMSVYIPAMLEIFAVLFVLWYTRKLFRSWFNY